MRYDFLHKTKKTNITSESETKNPRDSNNVFTEIYFLKSLYCPLREDKYQDAFDNCNITENSNHEKCILTFENQKSHKSCKKSSYIKCHHIFRNISYHGSIFMSME